MKRAVAAREQKRARHTDDHEDMVPLRLLVVVAEHPGGAEGLLNPLGALRPAPEVKTARDEADFVAQLGSELDAILLDDRSPLAAMRAMELMKERGRGLPLILLIDPAREAAAVAAMRAGATDYVMRDRPRRLAVILEGVGKTREKSLPAGEESHRRSHALLRAVTENSPDAIYVKGMDGKYLLANTPMGEIVGKPVSEVLGKDDAELFEPRTAARIAAVDRRVMDSGFTQIFEETHVAADGTLRTFISSKGPLRDDRGEVYGLVGISHDITARKRMEDALRRSEERYRSLALATTQIVWVASPAAEFLEGLENWCEFTGQTPAQARDHGWLDAVHPDDRARVMAEVGRAVGARNTMVLDCRVHTADGAWRHIEGRGVPVLSLDGSVREWIGTCTDVTGVRQARELEQERNSLRNAVGAMEQVLGVVAHELRTPLAATRAMAEFLLTDVAQPAENQPFLNAIHDEVIRMAGMVNDLLEVARLNSGTARWKWGEVNVAAACEAAVNTVRPLAKSGVAITLEVLPEGLAMQGDPEAIRRLVLNLASNACKFTDGGSIHVRARAAGDSYVELEVADTGRGMAPETVSRLGEAFALNAGIVGENHIHGTGLGLAICKGIVAAHGGRMCVDSEPGRGTMVWVKLRRDLPQAIQETGDAHIVRGLRS